MPQYDRRISVTVGEPGAAGVHIADLDIAFEVERFAEGQPSIGKADLYNLSETTRSRFKAGRDVMVIKAGYAEAAAGEAVCCQLDVFDARTERRDADTVTTLVGGDGIHTMRNRKLSVSYKGARDVKQIIRDVASKIQATLTDPALADLDAGTYQTGFADAGTAADVLDRLCGKLNASWSFQNGLLEVAPRNAPVSRAIVIVNVDTGLIGKPEKRQRVESTYVPVVRPGWIATCLLDPRIVPNGRVKLKSEEADGVYRVLSVKHSGYTRGAEFYTVADLAEW